MQTTATIASFGGKLLKLTHESAVTKCTMAANLYLPPQAKEKGKKIPLLIYLAGLTCTGDNGAEKGFFQHRASQRGVALLFPDTSPRKQNIPTEDDSYDFGSGAGFYIDATRDPWSKSYNMYSYITSELPAAVFGTFGDTIDESRVSIMGHSMGGHGALTLFLKNPGKYKSVSAFAPIANPSACPWGQKAFGGYFGDEVEGEKRKWAEHDATELVRGWEGRLDVLIDVGTSDNFYAQKQLLPENFANAAREAGVDRDGSVKIRMHEGYDHSYFFMASFADEHVDWAADRLGA